MSRFVEYNVLLGDVSQFVLMWYLYFIIVLYFLMYVEFFCIILFERMIFIGVVKLYIFQYNDRGISFCSLCVI